MPGDFYGVDEAGFSLLFSFLRATFFFVCLLFCRNTFLLQIAVDLLTATLKCVFWSSSINAFSYAAATASASRRLKSLHDRKGMARIASRIFFSWFLKNITR
ncbi:TPA: hypothetical protein RQN91_006025 [Klebsiella michiganensis]|nr:hypothetical protein [Klebsiella michiganensis]